MTHRVARRIGGGGTPHGPVLLRGAVGALLLFLHLVPPGCATSKKSQLEQVARDWCMTIRASQVLPVYPLTEDLQPGDLFLVQLPIDQQHKQYDEDGFLPFDNHLARLNPDGYGAFYANSFGIGGAGKELPKALLNASGKKEDAWKDAPQAGFPSYSVSVRRGGGFSAALPISGVPIGLSLMGSDAADVTVTIDKARTYGVDTVSLHATVAGWAERPVNRAFLASYAPTETQTNYLRVVSRVYLTGRLIATLSSAAATSAGGSAGAPKPVDLLTVNPGAPGQPGTAETFAQSLGKLNGSLNDSLKKATINGADVMLPGASIKVVAASARSITIAEDFIDRPLVIGYLGFDYAIGEQGTLGPPIPTYAVITKKATPETRPFFTADQEGIFVLVKTLDRAADADARFDVAAALIGPEFLGPYKAQRAEPRSGDAAFRSVLVDHLATEPAGRGQRHFVVLTALQRARDAALAPPPPPP